MDRIQFTILESQLGPIALVARGSLLLRLDVVQADVLRARKLLLEEFPDAVESFTPFSHLSRLLDRYLKGQRVEFDVPLELGGLRDFTRRVLRETAKIPYGRVLSYRALGRRLGYPMAARAVGQAMGRNPIPIVIPCHRVVREDFSLGGFGLGLHVKEKLLGLEGVQLDNLRASMLNC